MCLYQHINMSSDIYGCRVLFGIALDNLTELSITVEFKLESEKNLQSLMCKTSHFGWVVTVSQPAKACPSIQKKTNIVG